MDGLHAVWHGGPFAKTTRYVFHPRRILFGTDPVAIDRLLLDVIDDKRKAEGAISIWDRSPKYLKFNDAGSRDSDPNVNILIREPGHVEYAARLGPGRRRPREDPRGGDRGVSVLLFLATLPSLYWAQPVETAPALKQAGIERLCVPAEAAAAWQSRRLHRRPPRRRRTARSGRSSRPRACAPGPRWPPPRVRPWIFANGWRFLRKPDGRYWGDVPAGKAALAAAEAFAYGADVVLAIDPADLEAFGRMRAFLRLGSRLGACRRLADIAVVDDGSPPVAEILNLMARRNLLFRVVPKEAPDVAAQRPDRLEGVPAEGGAEPGGLRALGAPPPDGREALAAALRQRGGPRPPRAATPATRGCTSSTTAAGRSTACASASSGAGSRAKPVAFGEGRVAVEDLRLPPTARRSSRWD